MFLVRNDKLFGPVWSRQNIFGSIRSRGHRIYPFCPDPVQVGAKDIKRSAKNLASYHHPCILGVTFAIFHFAGKCELNTERLQIFLQGHDKWLEQLNLIIKYKHCTMPVLLLNYKSDQIQNQVLLHQITNLINILIVPVISINTITP